MVKDDLSDENVERVRESFHWLADDGLRLLRFTVVITGLYISAVGFLLQGESQAVASQLLTNIYTLLGAALLLLALGFSAVVYEPARMISVAPIYKERESKIYSQLHYRTSMWNLRAAVVAVLGGGLSLGLGLLDTFLPVSLPLQYVWGGFWLLLLAMTLPRVLMLGLHRTRSALSQVRSKLPF
ncbi:hypothetical protein N0B31_10675 [Salinirubellus salinus]|uniref:Uncharacterized protein n=1 Tax=Salinirubellus salinus TaxID=1364945 RepID=A0A9E7R943_9EURY|nr:hypothetical protein [Salinirubellus salinus]UWM56738.1 hypothetical protein N0B31_10675 [Salinirubellus salinus]